MNANNSLGHQGMSEQNAGYRAGLAGEPRPGKDKGRAYYNGWLNGTQERLLEEGRQNMIATGSHGHAVV